MTAPRDRGGAWGRGPAGVGAAATLLYCVSAAALVSAQPAQIAQRTETRPAPAAALRAPFRVGEVLTYSVSYAFLEAGTLRLAVDGVQDIDGRPAYHLTSRAQTNSTVSALYSLKDVLESWMDVERLHSLKFVKKSVEKGKTRERSFRLDQLRHVRIDEKKGEEQPMPPNAQDDLSVFYFLRTLPLKDGARFTLDVLMDPDDNPMKVAVLGSEKIRVPAGTFDCWVLRLDVETDSGVFSQGGELKVWMSRDARHVPVKLESKVAVGSFTAQLTELQQGSERPLTTRAGAASR